MGRTMSSEHKEALAKSIVYTVRRQNPPGRFLEKDAQTNLWHDVGDARAQSETLLALREKAPTNLLFVQRESYYV